MRLTTLRTDAGTTAARAVGDTLELLDFPDLRALLETGDEWRRAAEAEPVGAVEIGAADFAPLVPNPEKVFGIGLNYHGHAIEANLEIPDNPMVFTVFGRTLTGPYDEIELPANSDKVDWEIELGIVVGRPVKNASAEEAAKAIAGYTIVNDVSMRDFQLHSSQVTPGKLFEASTPVGPYLVTPDELPQDLSLEMRCYVDDELMQDASTSDLIFSPADVVGYLSEIITLVPGDVIATGTPSGVGGLMDPPRFIADGCTLRSTIEGLGEQRNLFRAAV